MIFRELLLLYIQVKVKERNIVTEINLGHKKLLDLGFLFSFHSL